MFPDVPAHDRAVPFYQKSHFLSITFTVSKYPADSLGQLIRRLRLERGLQRKELAKKLRVHRNSIYEWENDRHRPYGKSMERLAHFFKISQKNLKDFKNETKKHF